MGERSNNGFWRILSGLLVIALVIAGVFAYLNRQAILDHFAANSFTASAEIDELTDRLLLTDDGRRVFFATHPTIEASQRFNMQCNDVEHSEHGHILGCYTDDSIHLFDVRDERMNGIVEVTAAHELLHAVFSRLSTEERNDLSRDLNGLYTELSADDPELVERMSVYESLSPSAFANELHSVLGTEVRELPDWLEEHYARWFTDREIIIDYFEAYHGVFVEIQEKAESLQIELDALRESVEARSVAYDAAVTQFNADVDAFNQLNDNFGFSDNEGEFYRQLDLLRQRENALNLENEGIRTDIDRYNALREELEQLSAINQELNETLNSDLAPEPSPVNA